MTEFSGLMGESPQIVAIHDAIRRVARVNTTVLITGETGCGKGVVARQIHALSPHSDRPFVHVDSGALSPTLVESEIFGHERGAFTGALTRRAGRFELAGTGTIFLDEIGELDPALQLKFLRVLENREYERVGGRESITMGARVIAATSRDLPREIQQGRFRADLYFRLNVVHLRVPPLRQRLGDIPILVNAGVERIARRLQIRPPVVSDAVITRLMRYSWPGNVRELFNVLERLLVYCGECVDEAAVDAVLDQLAEPDVSAPSMGPPPTSGSAHPSAPVAENGGERAVLVEQVKAAGGNLSRVARRLGVPRSTLRYRIRRYGLQDLIPED